ncbi:hypothetical protein APHAL10511_000165 [Amanita phalloides]|nr:hypothetical protein APHAL10511_000165 [Amanita phalloides]
MPSTPPSLTWSACLPQLRGAGFNNQVQEILLFHHLALLTSRTYVYHPIVWRPRGEHSYIPLSAFLWGTTTNTISSAVFNEACPADKVKHVRLQTNHPAQWDLAKEVLNGDEPCLVVDDWILTWSFLASSSLQHIWPGYQDYLSSHFEWSQPIVDIVERTQRKLNISSKNFNRQGDRYMALHLRRGDFEDHCKYLAEKHVGFTTWATLPTLRSSITPPSLDTANLTSITEHCYPSLRRILHAVSQQAIKHPNLRTLHVLHDGAWDHPLVFLDYYKLVEALTNAAWAGRQRWADGQPMRRVTHSGMVQIHGGESDWRVAVDVELARRAEVFVGIGYSSLSTQVLALRLGADRGSTDDITLI